MDTELRVLQSGVATFFGRRQATIDELVDIDCAFLGVPWDEGNAGRNGANMGPRSVRDASSWFLGYDAQGGFDLWEEINAADLGDIPVIPPNAERTMDIISNYTEQVRDAGTLPFCIGGNHALTIGASRGVARTVKKMGFLVVDAHLDTSVDWAGERLTSGCPTMRAAEIDNVDPSNVVVFGVHGWLNPRDQVEAAAERGIRWYGSNEIQERGLKETLAEAIARASDGVDGLYVSIDLDSVDPAAFPSTGTPEPGGFTSRETIYLARELGRANPVGVDLVEIAPIYDVSGIGIRLACRVVMELLSGFAGK